MGYLRKKKLRRLFCFRYTTDFRRVLELTQLSALGVSNGSRSATQTLRMYNVFVVVCNISAPYRVDENACVLDLFSRLSTVDKYLKKAIQKQYNNYEYNVLDLTLIDGLTSEAIDNFFSKISNALVDRGSSK